RVLFRSSSSVWERTVCSVSGAFRCFEPERRPDFREVPQEESVKAASSRIQKVFSRRGAGRFLPYGVSTSTHGIRTLRIHGIIYFFQQLDGVGNVGDPVKRQTEAFFPFLQPRPLRMALDVFEDLDRKSTRLNSSHVKIS